MTTKAAEIRDMFATIATRYDRANTVLSGGMHHRWRRKMIDALDPSEDAHVLDVACGTGDVSLEIAERLGSEGRVTGVDFCQPMLDRAAEKTHDERVAYQLADATALPFDDNSFDGATIAFGIRNVVEPQRGLEEMCRVVRPGGRVAVLEFGQPDGPLMGPLYRAYSRWVIPLIGRAVTGHRQPYEYLPDTAAAFPAGRRFIDELMEPAGLVDCRIRPLMSCIAWIYVGTAPMHSRKKVVS